DKCRQDAVHCTAVHFLVYFLLVVTWLRCKGRTTRAPNWAADSTCASATSTLLTPWLFATARYFRTRFLCFSALACASSISNDYLMNQSFVELASKGSFGNFKSAFCVFQC